MTNFRTMGIIATVVVVVLLCYWFLLRGSPPTTDGPAADTNFNRGLRAITRPDDPSD